MLAMITTLGVAGAGACDAGAPTPPSAAEVADRGWRAHEHVVAAGERATTCAAAGAAMQQMFVGHRAAFVAALALDRDRARLAEATSYLEAHQDRYADLETRMQALAERCADAAAVQAVFAQMESP
jgi:hypothetical protein